MNSSSCNGTAMNEQPNTAGAFGGHVGGSADAIRGEIASVVSAPLQPRSALAPDTHEPVAHAGATDPIRVALLASAGEARDRLGAALADAGAQVTLVADLASIDTEQVRAAEPRALLVALEPAAYDQLDRLYQLLADPSLIVIFEEAELVSHRVGWDAARWIRHLGAKLRRHGEVLPPNLGRQEEEASLPERVSQDTAAFVGTIDTIVADVAPLEEAAPVEITAAIEIQEINESPVTIAEDQVQAIEVVEQATQDDLSEPVIVGEIEPSEPLESPVIAEDQSETIEVAEPVELPVVAAEDQEQAVDVVELAQDDADLVETVDVAVEQPQVDEEIVELSAEVGLEQEAEPEPQAVLEAASVEDVDSVIEFDASEAITSRSDFTPLPLVDVDALFASFSEPATQREPDVAREHAVVSTPQQAPVETAEVIDSSQWALVDDDEASAQSPLVVEAEAPADVAHELEVLEERISGLSLADTDSYGNGPPRGAVVVEAGLGGPDAVRQLLAALPETFSRPILVRLQLDGGRYDRLVRQMERVAKLPVALAASERPASPGTVYFMAPGLSLQRKGMELSFVDGALDAPSEFLAALPGEDSAHLFLSGSDPTRIDSAMAHIEARGLVAAQTTDGCYDSAAPAALIARGAVAGTPAELAARLIERWPS
jgi:chemosensory pili system protein ChpB (putative protein-glutamate methylesterase)